MLRQNPLVLHQTLATDVDFPSFSPKNASHFIDKSGLFILNPWQTMSLPSLVIQCERRCPHLPSTTSKHTLQRPLMVKPVILALDSLVI